MVQNMWNWQLEDWPHFSYTEAVLQTQEADFLKQSGFSFGISKHIHEEERRDITVNLMCTEAFKTSEIENEILDRDSLQSSIKRQFGFKDVPSRNHPRENGVAEMMIDLFHHFDAPLSHDTLCNWHAMLMNGRRDLPDIGHYRTHSEPMQVVSGYIHKQRVHFEAPPSETMGKEMETFVSWFNDTAPTGKHRLPALTRAAIAHLYFVSIHPFEDGNGRIGRALVEKALAQSLGQPTLIALSHIIQDQKKRYYEALEKQSRHNRIDDWLSYFADVILQAQSYTILEIEFLVQKTKFNF